MPEDVSHALAQRRFGDKQTLVVLQMIGKWSGVGVVHMQQVRQIMCTRRQRVKRLLSQIGVAAMVVLPSRMTC
jgi:hypothetical protein